MKMDRLIVHAAADRLTGSTPGSFVLDACGLVVRATSVRAAQFRTREVTGTRHACRRTVATCVVLGTRTASSTPLAIALNHPRFFVSRRLATTLVTRPLLSWWTRRMAVQPVVRKAELLRGGCSEEEATQINGRSLA